MFNPYYKNVKTQYEINKLAFGTQMELMNSNLITSIVPPFPSMTDKRNKRGPENYKRYISLGNYISNPAISFDSSIGITNKEPAIVNLPENMQDIIYYATKEGTDIQTIQNQIMKDIFVYGGSLLEVSIPEGISIADNLPKLKVHSIADLLDYSSFKNEKGFDEFKWLVFDSSSYMFDESNKNYNYVKVLTIHGLNSAGVYYIAEIFYNDYQTFNFSSPEVSKCISYYEPSWNTQLDFIPFVAINKLDCTVKYDTSFVQDLINLSLENYRLSCNLGWLEQAASSSHLVIKGKNLDGDVNDYPVGATAVHLLRDDTAQEYYVTPSTAGMAEIKEHIQQNNELISNMQYSLLNASANSSGEALQFRIAVKVTDLIGLVKNIGKAMTLSLEYIDEIINNGVNKDLIEYLPYLDFDKVSSFLGNESEEEDKSQENLEK